MDPKLCVIVNRADSDLGPRGPELCKLVSQRWRQDSTVGLADLPNEDHSDDASAKRDASSEHHQGGEAGGHGGDEGGDHGDHDHDDHNHHHEVPRHKMPFYKAPYARYQWGVPRPNRHVGSSQLFFDLLYVGVSFRSGSLLGEDLTWKNVLIFLATILLMYGAWFSRLTFDAMLQFDDNCHRFLFVTQALLLGLAAHQLTEVSELEDYSNGQALGFTICMLASHLLQLGIWLELWITAHDQPNAKAYGRIAAIMECVPVCVIVISLAMILTEQSLLAVATVWLLTYIVSRLAWTGFVVSGSLSKANSIPWDVGFCILRFGQFTMLMLGEGVLQIIIFSGNDHGADIPVLTADWIALFFLCYALMGILQLLHFTTLPFNENDHILLRGPVSVASMWIELFALYSCALVACGVALKKMLYLHNKLYPDVSYEDEDYQEAKYEAKKYSAKRDKYYFFLAAALACATFLLAVQQLLQVDIWEELGIRFSSQDEDVNSKAKPSLPDKSSDDDQAEEGSKKASLRSSPSPPSQRRRGSRRNRMYFAQGHERKRVWFARLVLVPCTFFPLGAADFDPVYVILIADVLLLALLSFDIFRGKFKRKRKLNRTVAAIIAIAKLKRFVRLRREQRERLQQECMERARLLANDQDGEKGRGSPEEDCSADHLQLFAEEEVQLHGHGDNKANAGQRHGRGRSNSESSTGSRSRRQSFVDGVLKTASAASGPVRLAHQMSSHRNHRAKNYVRIPALSTRKAIMRQLRATMRETAFYRPYVPRVDWQHLHSSHEMEWQNLFYDLVVVALAYRLNQVEFSDLENFQFSTLVLYVFEASAVLDCWNQRNILQSRFLSEDVFHRAVGLFQFGLVAFLSSEVIVSSQVRADPERFTNYLYSFATAKLLYELTTVMQAFELYFTFRNRNAPAEGSARRYIYHYSINVALLVCSFFCIAFEANVLLTVFLWGAGHYITLLLVFVESSTGCVTKRNSLPVDVGFLSHRESELGLIMIGEGLLSIINADVTQAVEHYVNFVLGYAVIAATKVNYFFIQRFNPPELASRKSRLRGVAVAWFLPIFMVALSAVGGIAVWTYVEDSDFGAPIADEYIFRALPLSVVAGLLCFFDFMHEGPQELVYMKCAPGALSLVYLAKLIAIGGFWLEIYVHVPSSATLGLFFVDLALLFVAHAAHVEVRARVAATIHITRMETPLPDVETGAAPSAQEDETPTITLADEEGPQLCEDDNDVVEDTYEDVIPENRGREIALG
ncbi:Hypothetical Protein FCC1311_008482 [Hondaea fermentalgiana]|uniref:Uncharacterized protein n=1 Tax=Hondaea fermentalgiana TaxID=2315210 RepID=A0A2R5G2S8_9STRA|nr:Hypothetical Protein FCC1311_008482 [Hondaea fermentalgiana]|eukprot:GBG24629.1 Hypothetical Protein FCC1311_008482 [Hondaea fermentalgiana]